MLKPTCRGLININHQIHYELLSDLSHTVDIIEPNFTYKLLKLFNNVVSK